MALILFASEQESTQSDTERRPGLLDGKHTRERWQNSGVYVTNWYMLCLVLYI